MLLAVEGIGRSNEKAILAQTGTYPTHEEEEVVLDSDDLLAIEELHEIDVEQQLQETSCDELVGQVTVANFFVGAWLPMGNGFESCAFVMRTETVRLAAAYRFEEVIETATSKNAALL